jgi:3-hydroxyacyl-[acyl-carrier-protein] dehydratase
LDIGIWDLFGICDLGFGILNSNTVKVLLGLIEMLNLEEILQRLPHVFPFRMIDRILEVDPGKKAVAVKNVSIDEPHLTGHFPHEPIMPSVLILEALAQTGGLAFHSLDEPEKEGVPVLAKVEEFRFRKKVLPGDQIILEAEVLHIFSSLAKVKVSAKVRGEIVAEGTLVLARGTTASPSPH